MENRICVLIGHCVRRLHEVRVVRVNVTLTDRHHRLQDLADLNQVNFSVGFESLQKLLLFHLLAVRQKISMLILILLKLHPIPLQGLADLEEHSVLDRVGEAPVQLERHQIEPEEK